MTRWPVTVRPTSSTKEALRLLDDHAITSLPVVHADGRIVGVVSEADLVRDSLPHDPRARMIPDEGGAPAHPTRVDEVMNHHPVTVEGDVDLAEAVDLMTSTSVKSIPVVDRGLHVIGVVSRRDIVHVLARADDRVQSELDELFRSLGVDWLVVVKEGAVTVDGPQGDKARALAEAAAATVPGVMSVTVVEPPARRTGAHRPSQS
jgi:CBS domain-containing protein